LIVAGSLKGVSDYYSKGDNTFPNDPSEFNPKGLTKQTYNTKNGKIIKWFDSNGKAVYEWDEDFNYGSHYHVIGEDGNTRVPNASGETHFKAGDEIPKSGGK